MHLWPVCPVIGEWCESYSNYICSDCSSTVRMDSSFMECWKSRPFRLMLYSERGCPTLRAAAWQNDSTDCSSTNSWMFGGPLSCFFTCGVASTKRIVIPYDVLHSYESIKWTEGVLVRDASTTWSGGSSSSVDVSQLVARRCDSALTACWFTPTLCMILNSHSDRRSSHISGRAVRSTKLRIHLSESWSVEL